MIIMIINDSIGLHVVDVLYDVIAVGHLLRLTLCSMMGWRMTNWTLREHNNRINHEDITSTWEKQYCCAMSLDSACSAPQPQVLSHPWNIKYAYQCNQRRTTLRTSVRIQPTLPTQIMHNICNHIIATINFLLRERLNCYSWLLYGREPRTSAILELLHMASIRYYSSWSKHISNISKLLAKRIWQNTWW